MMSCTIVKVFMGLISLEKKTSIRSPKLNLDYYFEVLMS